MSKYNKLFVALTGAVVQLLTIYFSDALWLPAVIPFVTALGVYATPNRQG